MGRNASPCTSGPRGVPGRVAVIAALWLLLPLLVACSGESAGHVPRVVSLTPLGTRALRVLALPHELVAADAASARLLAPSPPEASLDDALAHRPDLVLVGDRAPGDEARVETLRAAGVAVVEVAPHQMVEALAVFEELAAALGEPRRGAVTANRIGDRFAVVSAAQLGRPRPRVAVLVGLEPLVLAGGHSFETDLVETAGGESVTHGDEALRTETDPTRLRALRPDLVVVGTAPHIILAAARGRIAAALAPVAVRFVALDTDVLWLGDAGDVLVAWQALIDEARLAGVGAVNAGAARPAPPPSPPE